MKRTILATLLLLTTLGAGLAHGAAPQVWTPAGVEEPTPSVITTYKTATWRYGFGTQWAEKSRGPGVYTCNNAGWLPNPDPAPNADKRCEVDDASALVPPVVIPPPPPPPPANLPAGVTRIAVAPQFFAHTTRMEVRLCDFNFTEALCSRPALFLAAPDNIGPDGQPIVGSGGGHFCVASNFQGVKTAGGVEACFKVPDYVPPSERRCYPSTADVVVSLLPPVTFKSKFYRYIPVPTTFGNLDRDKLLVWVDTCSGKTDFEFFKWGDLPAIAAAAAGGELKDSDSIKAWRRTQPVEDTIPDAAFDWAVSYALLQDGAVTPTPTCKVIPSSKTVLTRQVYGVKLNAQGVPIVGSPIAGMLVMQGTPVGAQLSAAAKTYYSVAGQVATDGRVIPAGSVAVATCS